MRQIISLRPDDEIAVIRAKIENAEFTQVALVVPPDCVALAVESGMSLIRRAAEDAGMEVALVTRDEEMRERARRFGLPTFNSIARAQRERWRVTPLAQKADASPATLSPHARLARFLSRQRGALALLIGAMLLLCSAAFLLIPAARVRLVPAPVALTLSTDVIADPTISQVSSAQRWVPARKVTREINGTAQLKTATQRSIPDARSTGTVIFTNQRNEETTIPQGAIVKTSGGVTILFTIATTVTLPAGIGNRVEAPIQAADPGPSGNVKELTINTIEGTLNVQARVINLQATRAGNLRNVRVVTADDKKKLEEQLTQQLLKQAPSVLASVLKPNELILPDSVVIDANETAFDRAADEPADVLNLRIAGYAIGLAVDREDLDALVRALVQRQLQEGYELLPSGIKSEALAGGKYQYPAFKFPLRGTGYAIAQIDNAKVARALQGKTVQDAESFLTENLSLAQPPEISVLPPGWVLLPWFSFRIAVFVEPQEVSVK